MVTKNAYEVPLQSAFVGLQKAVASQIKRTAKFRTLLKRIDKTLRTIESLLYANGRLARVLDRPEKETKMFIFYLENGKETVLKCSKIKCWNVYKKFVHANKLIRLDHELLRFFQAELQDNLSVKFRGIDLGGQVVSSVTKRAGGFSSSCKVPGLPDVIVGLDSHFKEVKRVLLKDDNQVVIVSAPGGCGKTTLARMLCHDDEIKGIFRDNIFYVTVSRTTSLKTVVQKLFTHHLHLNDCEFQTDEEAKNELENMIRQMGPQRTLLVLDDVWSESESLIQDLKFLIPGYTILVTSRFRFSSIGSTYELSLLNDEDARTLLCHSAFPCEGNRINVPDDLVSKMVKCCKGFPLALTVIGASLRDQSLLKWKKTLQKLSEGQSIFDLNSLLLLSLRASVDALEDLPIACDCFLDLGSFPEDEKISASALMDMWVVLYNLDKEGMYTIEYLLELSSRNLLSLVLARKDASELEGYCNEHHVTQHDLLRELAIHLSSQEPIAQRKRLLIEIHGNDIPAWWIDQTQQPIDTRLMSISTDETFSSVWYDLKAPKVQALVLNIRSKIYALPHFIKDFNDLRVLNITSYGIYPTELHELPLISSLPNLRRLRLEHLSLFPSIQSIFKLNNLEKLSMIMCEIGSALESCTVEPPMLPNLVELEIESCYDLKEVPPELCSLDRLTKLSITNCHELVALPEGFGSLSNLEILRLHSCTRLSKLPDSIGRLHNLVFLDISDCLSISSLPDQIGELNGLRVLKMSGCHGLEELPDSVTNLTLLEDVICDEETSYLWSYYEGDLCDLKINVVEEDRLANFMKIVG
ncbi:putative powdery mildew resistance protein, RPW8 [Helianthus annuus]|uniref:Powdery mildew resistance protein, RPW8 n=2 Tax=Helianthus annuus TaxID=4232 RepID=A0A9K3E3I1_HELAN|nr:probable disease resistance protein At5g66900 [Helianthus annuus]XP_022012800.1 probable disease resistance protein At5g66900 [Helianthus annuus]KAF5766250.1 putative powdery mildew resistance protein, RPW8 [Helianthus annuus]KAJ0452677.1 putative powdery mildew resistance protein, RPW8 [Helianthus annuus]KAJ0474584.1 putative powdery mildew resistance protein, RPW8 [Helianthus annuus]KAJ0650141.1 putative powdery mildew resistance protein, RPW8 [Helianthus annuus]KAJ0653914.1 putative pow